MGGLVKEVCDADWAANLGQLSAAVFQPHHDTYFLKSPPDLTAGKSLTVKIDGVVIPPTTAGGATVWSYDAISNAVVFAPLYVPQPGQAVAVSYSATCL